MGLFEGVGSDVMEVGRATFVHHSGFCPGGVTLVNMYLHTGEGLSGANESILLRVGTLLQVPGRPFIIAGDFN
eukprot:3059176-Pyramimonas_sp.AAC.1